LRRTGKRERNEDSNTERKDGRCHRGSRRGKGLKGPTELQTQKREKSLGKLNKIREKGF